MWVQSSCRTLMCIRRRQTIPKIQALHFFSLVKLGHTGNWVTFDRQRWFYFHRNKPNFIRITSLFIKIVSESSQCLLLPRSKAGSSFNKIPHFFWLPSLGSFVISIRAYTWWANLIPTLFGISHLFAGN